MLILIRLELELRENILPAVSFITLILVRVVVFVHNLLVFCLMDVKLSPVQFREITCECSNVTFYNVSSHQTESLFSRVISEGKIHPVH